MAFRLRKYYLDATSADGNVVIAYWASLRWGALRLRYAAVDWFDASGTTTAKSSIGAPPPEESPEGVRWKAPGLGVAGRWSPTVAPVVRELYARGGRSVTWSCLAPAAEVELGVGPRSLVGAGYVERLDCTIEPWRLPVDVLHWGRIADGDMAATWISWEGPHPLRLLFVGGAERHAPEISPTRISWDDGTIALAPERTLRSARLGEGAMRAIPRLLRRTPLRILAAHETKWLSRARGTWCVHEVVRFPDGSGTTR